MRIQTEKVSPHDAYEIYLAVKLHFSKDDYNYNAGAGRIKTKSETFDKRNDKYMFHKLSKLYTKDYIQFLVSNFIEDENLWSKQLLSKECVDIYTRWKGRLQSMENTFSEELKEICSVPDKFNESLRVVDGQHPRVIELYLQGTISLETLVIINNLTKCVGIWDRQITDDIIYPKISRRIKKYGSFLSVDVEKYRQIVVDTLSE
jgi:hypothetical protein